MGQAIPSGLELSSTSLPFAFTVLAILSPVSHFLLEFLFFFLLFF